MKITNQSIEVKSTIFELIDIFRGLAAFSVVLYHSRVDLWVGWNEIRSHPQLYSTFEEYIAILSIPMPFMGTTVMLFFILSGFCIHYPNKDKVHFDVSSYFKRRFIRIYPPYIVTIFYVS